MMKDLPTWSTGRMDKYIDLDVLTSMADTIVDNTHDRAAFNGPHDAYGKLIEEADEVDIETAKVAYRIEEFHQLMANHGSLEELIATSYHIKKRAILAAKELIQVAAMAERNIRGCINNQDKYVFYPRTIKDREEANQGRAEEREEKARKDKLAISELVAKMN